MRSVIIKTVLFAVVVCATVGMVAFGQQNPPAQPTGADPYLNNAAAGTTAFPLAAPPGNQRQHRPDSDD